VLTDQEFEAFMEEYNAAQSAVGNRENAIQRAVKSIERDMTFLGVSGVEDKL
jgi:phospholipid-translocating ATPase